MQRHGVVNLPHSTFTPKPLQFKPTTPPTLLVTNSTAIPQASKPTPLPAFSGLQTTPNPHHNFQMGLIVWIALIGAGIADLWKTKQLVLLKPRHFSARHRSRLPRDLKKTISLPSFKSHICQTTIIIVMEMGELCIDLLQPILAFFCHITMPHTPHIHPDNHNNNKCPKHITSII